MDEQNLTKFCVHIIIDKIYVGIVKDHFILQILQQTYGPWLLSGIGFAQYLDKRWTEFNQILFTHWQHLCKYFKLFYFLQIGNGVTALDWC